jgi:hypothetical protein
MPNLMPMTNFISALYFFYADRAYHGVDAEKSQELGWFLPRKKLSYVNYLDSLLIKTLAAQ